MNKAIIMGRLTSDIELKRTQSDVPYINFTVAVKKNYSKDKDASDFIDCVAWRHTAEFLSKYFNKGDMLALSGSIETRYWEDAESKKRKAVEILVEDVYFTGGKSSGTSDNTASTPSVAQPAATTQTTNPDDDLPF